MDPAPFSPEQRGISGAPEASGTQIPARAAKFGTGTTAAELEVLAMAEKFSKAADILKLMIAEHRNGEKAMSEMELLFREAASAFESKNLGEISNATKNLPSGMSRLDTILQSVINETSLLSQLSAMIRDGNDGQKNEMNDLRRGYA